MFSGDAIALVRELEDYGKLLVKKEWDAAEAWMKIEEEAGRINP